MAVSGKLYASMPLNLGGSNASGGSSMDLLSDVLKHMLTTSTYTPNQTTHTIKSDVTNEVVGTAYVAGGATLGTKTYSVSSLVTTFDAADTTWSTSTITTRNGVIYDDTVATPVKPLICYFDFGGDQTTSGTDLTIQYNASGIFTITVA